MERCNFELSGWKPLDEDIPEGISTPPDVGALSKEDASCALKQIRVHSIHENYFKNCLYDE